MDELEEPFEVRIRNCGGVPVLEVAGLFNLAAVAGLEKVIGTLCSAGHYQIVLNIKKVAEANVDMIEKLREMATTISKHHGAIDIVAEVNQIRQLLSLDGIARFFRFCTSEGEAIRRIKKLTRLPEMGEPGCNARIVEAK